MGTTTASRFGSALGIVVVGFTGCTAFTNLNGFSNGAGDADASLQDGSSANDVGPDGVNNIIENDTGGGSDAPAGCTKVPGLVAHWTFDTNTVDGTSVIDSSGSQKNGTLSGLTPPKITTQGRFAEALEFPKTSFGQVYVPNVALDTTANAFNTVSLWFFRQGGDKVDDAIIYMPSDPRYDLWLTTMGNLEFLCVNTQNLDCWGIETTPNALRDRWVHVAVSFFNGPTVKSELYVDGTKRVLSCLTSRGFNDCTHSRTVATPMQLGGGTEDYPFRGKLDDVRIYSRGLSEAEVSALFVAGVCP